MPRRSTPKNAADRDHDADTDDNAIDASFTEEMPAPAEAPETPPPVQAIPLTRTAILEAARSLNSAAMGTAAWIESHCMSGHIRPLFIDSWRKWHGGLLSFTAAFERLPMNLVDAQRTVARQQELLEQWRAGARGEVAAMGGAEVGAAPQVVQQHGAQPVVKPQGVVNTLPFWAKLALGGGLIYGAVRGADWLVRQWGTGSTPEPTTEAKAK